MSRRRWVYINGEGIELTPDTVLPDRASTQSHDGLLWNDRHYQGLAATDGTPIDSRTKHREYMKRHNLTTMDDFTETFKREEKKRDAYRTEGRGGAVSREHIERAIHELSKRR
jgi:hypothetical protein